MTAAATQKPRPRRQHWTWSLMAAFGFLIATVVIFVQISRQAALTALEDYLAEKYQFRQELPIDRVTLGLRSDAQAIKPQAEPPLGVCWQIRIRAAYSRVTLEVNPWTYEIVAVDGEFLFEGMSGESDSTDAR